jgi:hypothetical protein
LVIIDLRRAGGHVCQFAKGHGACGGCKHSCRLASEQQSHDKDTMSQDSRQLEALESAIAKRLDQGDLVGLEIRRRGLAGLFGKYRADPTLREICETVYKERDADVHE